MMNKNNNTQPQGQSLCKLLSIAFQERQKPEERPAILGMLDKQEKQGIMGLTKERQANGVQGL